MAIFGVFLSNFSIDPITILAAVKTVPTLLSSLYRYRGSSIDCLDLFKGSICFRINYSVQPFHMVGKSGAAILYHP